MTPPVPPDLARLAAHLGRPLAAAELLKSGARADSWRLVPADSQAPRGLVFKQFHRLDRFAAAELETYRLLAAAPNIVPPCLARDQVAGWLVVEEMAGAKDLFGLLARGDAPDGVMAGMGRTMGRLMAATVPLAGESGPADPTVRRAEADRLTADGPRVAAWASSVGAPWEPALGQPVAQLIAGGRDPEILGWTQGDPAPSNVIGDGRRTLLVDFEYGAWRHPLFDLAQWYVRCPLPRSWFESLADSALAELPAEAPLADRAAFRRQLGGQIALAGLYMLGWLPAAAALDADRAWVGPWTVRDALCSTADRLADVDRFDPALSPLACWAAGLREALLARWPQQRRERGPGALDWARLIAPP